MGRWRLWRGGRSSTLFPQTRVSFKCERGCLSFGNDSQSADCLQSTGESSASRSPAKDHHARYALCENTVNTRTTDDNYGSTINYLGDSPPVMRQRFRGCK